MTNIPLYDVLSVIDANIHFTLVLPVVTLDNLNVGLIKFRVGGIVSFNLTLFTAGVVWTHFTVGTETYCIMRLYNFCRTVATSSNYRIMAH